MEPFRTIKYKKCTVEVVDKSFNYMLIQSDLVIHRILYIRVYEIGYSMVWSKMCNRFATRSSIMMWQHCYSICW